VGVEAGHVYMREGRGGKKGGGGIQRVGSMGLIIIINLTSNTITQKASGPV